MAQQNGRLIDARIAATQQLVEARKEELEKDREIIDKWK